MTTDSMFAAGALINNRYQMLAEVPYGTSLVQAIDHDNNQRKVVLRILSQYELNAEKDVNQFYQEQLEIVKLSHKNIAAVCDFGVIENQFYVASEVVPGITLADFIIDNSKDVFDLSLYATILSQLAEGLHHAHSCGIIHSALSPNQILVTADGAVKTTGFGLRVKPNLNWCWDGEVYVSLREQALYDSPECILGENFDQSADIYSFGLIAYQCAVGQVPLHREKDYSAVCSKQMSTPIPPFANRNNQVPKWYEQMVIKCTQKKTIDRYQKFDAILAILSNDR